MSQLNSQNKKPRILWDRVVIAVFIVLVIIIFSVALLSKLFSKKSEPPKNTLSSASQSNSESDNTINANYKFIELNSDEISKGNLILVNNDIKFSTSAPTDLVTVYSKKTKSYQVKDAQVSLKPEVITALNKMADDFATAKNNKNLMVISGYRDLNKQQELYDAELKRTNSTSSTLVALPGHSEHHTGYAIDFGVYPADGVYKNFDGTGDYAWIDQNCYKYGFILRYRTDKASITKIDNEPWHFRYVGQPHAYIMQQKNLCYEEYIDYIKQFEFGKNNLKFTNFDGTQYEIYYVKNNGLTTKLPVPKNHDYSFSGNNTDGFIVTVKLS